MAFNSGIIRSAFGILMLLELVLGLVAWSILVSFDPNGLLMVITNAGLMKFAKFCFIFPWILLLILFTILVSGVNERASLPWREIQIGVHVTSAILMVTGSSIVAYIYSAVANSIAQLDQWSSMVQSVMSSMGLNPDLLIAAMVFGFVVGLLYIVSTKFACKKQE